MAEAKIGAKLDNIVENPFMNKYEICFYKYIHGIAYCTDGELMLEHLAIH